MSLHDGCLRNAANNGEIDRVVELLGLGANPNLFNNQGDTALVLAARSGFSNVVRVLLQHGADPLLRGDGQLSPLAAAISNGHHEVVDLLLGTSGHHSHDWLQDGLYWAVISGEPSIARTLLATGADPLRLTKTGKTLLEVAREWFRGAGAEYHVRCSEIIAIFEQHIAGANNQAPSDR
jgi:hypothetical protein